MQFLRRVAAVTAAFVCALGGAPLTAMAFDASLFYNNNIIFYDDSEDCIEEDCLRTNGDDVSFIGDSIGVGLKDYLAEQLTELDTSEGNYNIIEVVDTKYKQSILKGLLIVHDSQYYKIDSDDCIEDSGFDVGVDSGEVGIYDYDKYPVDGIDVNPKKIEDDYLPYRTPNGNWGVTVGNFGGDGSFSAYVHRNNDNIIDAIFIDFSKYDDDDENDEEDDDFFY